MDPKHTWTNCTAVHRVLEIVDHPVLTRGNVSCVVIVRGQISIRCSAKRDVETVFRPPNPKVSDVELDSFLVVRCGIKTYLESIPVLVIYIPGENPSQASFLVKNSESDSFVAFWHPCEVQFQREMRGRLGRIRGVVAKVNRQV